MNNELPLGALYESPNNPRRNYDPDKMAELIASVKKSGVHEDLLVRPDNDGRFEILSGHRRFRAAQAARLGLVGCKILHLDDDEALELLLLANLQREDVHPLEEGIGFQTLLARPGQSVASVAAKIGKSESYVYGRMRLTELVEDARTAFLDGRINAAQAIAIARLNVADQAEALTQCTRNWSPLSASELLGWIRNNLLLKFDEARFPTDDPTLIAAAGSCTDCPQRTRNSETLFPEFAADDRCMDPKCFHAKIDAVIARKEAAAKRAGEELVKISLRWTRPDKQIEGISYPHDTTIVEPANEPCGHSVRAVVVDDDNRGEEREICRDPKCPVHGEGGVDDNDEPSPEDLEAEAEQERQLRERQEKRLARELKLKAYIQSTDEPTRLDLLMIGESLFGMSVDFPEELTLSLGLSDGFEAEEFTSALKQLSFGGIVRVFGALALYEMFNTTLLFDEWIGRLEAHQKEQRKASTALAKKKSPAKKAAKKAVKKTAKKATKKR